MNRYIQITDFLAQLRDNNNKEWFDLHRKEYNAIKKMFNSFVEDLIHNLGEIDPSVASLSVSQCTYRINRDIRFSTNKEPYKTHMGVYIVPGGKKSGYAGYYIHFEPSDPALSSDPKSPTDLNMNKSMIAVGAHCPEPKVLRSIREEILDNGDELMAKINNATKYSLFDGGESLKRTPQGFPKDSKYDNLLRMKHIHLTQTLKPNFFVDDDSLVSRLVDELKPTVAFLAQLNRAIEYAYTEM